MYPGDGDLISPISTKISWLMYSNMYSSFMFQTLDIFYFETLLYSFKVAIVKKMKDPISVKKNKSLRKHEYTLNIKRFYSGKNDNYQLTAEFIFSDFCSQFVSRGGSKENPQSHILEKK